MRKFYHQARREALRVYNSMRLKFKTNEL